jgi:hypothetical protein
LIANQTEDGGLSKDEVELILSGFCSYKNSDVQSFIRDVGKARRFESADKCRTFLVFDDESSDCLFPLAYFSLSFKSVTIDVSELVSCSSGSERKRLDGFSTSVSNPINAFLIGQIGINDAHPCRNRYGLPLLMEIVWDRIQQVRKGVGGRVVILECEPVNKLVAAYEKVGFKRIAVAGESSLLTMYRVIS